MSAFYSFPVKKEEKTECLENYFKKENYRGE